ncbi:unnamed protein product, partial [marine sediment metagenome]
RTTDSLLEYVDEKDKTAIHELKKQGYRHSRKNDDPLIPGVVLYTKKMGCYELKRNALIFKVYGWEKYNAYAKGYYGFVHWKGRPDDYNKKQVTFTKSLRNLCGKRLIDLANSWFGLIPIYDKGLAEKLEIEPSDFELEKEKAMEQSKQSYLKQKEADPRIGTFDQWFNERITNALEGHPTRRAIWESFHN